MNKLKLNYFIDILMFIFFLVTAISGLFLFFFLPSGIRRAGLYELFGILRKDWVDVHSLFGLLFILFIIIHLILHWRWICETTKGYLKNKKK